MTHKHSFLYAVHISCNNALLCPICLIGEWCEVCKNLIYFIVFLFLDTQSWRDSSRRNNLLLPDFWGRVSKRWYHLLLSWNAVSQTKPGSSSKTKSSIANCQSRGKYYDERKLNGEYVCFSSQRLFVLPFKGGASEVEWLRSLTSNRLPLLAVGSNSDKDFEFFHTRKLSS
jgi:hypothetical protein